MVYQKLLEITSPPSVTDSPLPISVDRPTLQSLWFSGRLPREFHDLRGRSVQIIDPGQWNQDSDPDFLGATIQIDHRIVNGPIQIVLDSQQWALSQAHHLEISKKPVLHLSLNDIPARNLQDRQTTWIQLKPEQVQQALGHSRLNGHLSQSKRCFAPFKHLSQKAIDDLLKQAALHRAQKKHHSFNKTAALHGFDQALWESFAETLGYSKNQLPMRLLAQRIPLKKLRSLRQLDREAILFGAAGFLSPNLYQKCPADSQRWITKLWQRWWTHRYDFDFSAHEILSWSSHPIRPCNHPHRRIAALAAISSSIDELVSQAQKDPPFRAFRKAIHQLTNPFWDYHYTLTSKRTARPIKLIGKQRLEDFLINHLHPLHAHKRDSFFELKASSISQKVRQCSQYLFGSVDDAQNHLTHLWHHQGILQISQDFLIAHPDDHNDAAFPKHLIEWKVND
jgi:hypothetical protein